MIYLDNSATTQPCEAAISAMARAMTESWHNPSALYTPAIAVEKQLRAVREHCLRAAGAEGQRLLFTSGGTEADNLAILGHMLTEAKPGTVLLSELEHPAVSACVTPLKRLGHTVRLMPVTSGGLVDTRALAELMDSTVRLICVMQVNNETGAIQPVDEIVRLRSRLCPEALIHVDGVQGFLRVPVDFNRRGIDSYAFSGHKIHAVKGIGGLIVRSTVKLSPLLWGGGQEAGLRSGTENTPGILALGAAVDAFPEDGIGRMAQMKLRLFQRLKTAIPDAEANGPRPGDPASAPHILNVSLPPVRSETMLNALDGEGICVSAGSACGSRRQKTSTVLAAMRLPQRLADCALRFSLSPYTTAEEIDTAADAVARHYKVLSKYVRR